MDEHEIMRVVVVLGWPLMVIVIGIWAAYEDRSKRLSALSPHHIKENKEMNRSEHLQWCKDRANAYLDAGKIDAAFASMVSDIGKHKETENPYLIEIGGIYAMNRNPRGMRGWIDGFN